MGSFQKSHRGEVEKILSPRGDKGMGEFSRAKPQVIRGRQGGIRLQMRGVVVIYRSVRSINMLKLAQDLPMRV